MLLHAKSNEFARQIIRGVFRLDKRRCVDAINTAMEQRFNCQWNT